MAAKITALHPCECSNWAFDLDADSDTDYDTGCTAQTVRTFAQGHDAKLAGFMVRAEIAGHGISRTDGGMLSTWGNAVIAALTISEPFAAKVEAQIEAQRRRSEKKAEKAPRKAAKTTATPAEGTPAAPEALETAPEPKPTTRHASIKVGRWTYRAAIMLATGEAHYTTKLGADKTAPAGTYTEVN